jgi:hypothetical protein
MVHLLKAAEHREHTATRRGVNWTKVQARVDGRGSGHGGALEERYELVAPPA